MRIGLTGGIGSGKSTVAKMFADWGALVIDADAISRELMQPGQSVLAETIDAFGVEILTATGQLDRQALATKIFADANARDTLNSIVHPAVREESARIARQAQQKADFSGVIIEDIPLLAETDQAKRFDAVVVVEADMSTRLQRLVETRGMRKEDALARMAAQVSDEQRRAIATYVIDNSGSLAQTESQVEQIWQKIQS